MGQEAVLPADQQVVMPPDLPERMAAVTSAAAALQESRGEWFRRLTDSLAEPTYTDPRTISAVAELCTAWQQEVTVYAEALSTAAALAGEAVAAQAATQQQGGDYLSGVP